MQAEKQNTVSSFYVFKLEILTHSLPNMGVVFLEGNRY